MFDFNWYLGGSQAPDSYPEPSPPDSVQTSRAPIHEPEVFPEELTTTSVVVNKFIETMYDLALETLHTYSIMDNEKEPFVRNVERIEKQKEESRTFILDKEELHKQQTIELEKTDDPVTNQIQYDQNVLSALYLFVYLLFLVVIVYYVCSIIYKEYVKYKTYSDEIYKEWRPLPAKNDASRSTLVNSALESYNSFCKSIADRSLLSSTPRPSVISDIDERSVLDNQDTLVENCGDNIGRSEKRHGNKENRNTTIKDSDGLTPKSSRERIVLREENSKVKSNQRKSSTKLKHAYKSSKSHNVTHIARSPVRKIFNNEKAQDTYNPDGKLGRMTSGIIAEVAKDLQRDALMQGSLHGNLQLESEKDENSRLEQEKLQQLQKQFTLSRLQSLASIKLCALKKKTLKELNDKTDNIDKWAAKKIELYDNNKELQQLVSELHTHKLNASLDNNEMDNEAVDDIKQKIGDIEKKGMLAVVSPRQPINQLLPPISPLQAAQKYHYLASCLPEIAETMYHLPKQKNEGVVIFDPEILPCDTANGIIHARRPMHIDMKQ